MNAILFWVCLLACSIVDASEYKWSVYTCEDSAFPRDGAVVVSHEDTLYLLGGWNPIDRRNFPKICSNEVMISYEGLHWRTVHRNTFGKAHDPKECWEGRHSAGWVVFQDKLWTIGGDGNQGHYQSDVWFSDDGISWIKCLDNASWGPRLLHYVVGFHDAIWLMGGQTIPQDCPGPERYYRDIWRSEDGVVWEKVEPEEPYWSARGAICGSVVFQGRMWVIGGGTYDTPGHPRRYYGDVWASEDGVHWECVCKKAPWQPREYHNVIVFDDQIWVMGGYCGYNLHDVWSSYDGEKWIDHGYAPWSPRHAACCFVCQDALYLMLGSCMTNEVWCMKKVNEP